MKMDRIRLTSWAGRRLSYVTIIICVGFYAIFTFHRKTQVAFNPPRPVQRDTGFSGATEQQHGVHVKELRISDTASGTTVTATSNYVTTSGTTVTATSNYVTASGTRRRLITSLNSTTPASQSTKAINISQLSVGADRTLKVEELSLNTTTATERSTKPRPNSQLKAAPATGQTRNDIPGIDTRIRDLLPRPHVKQANCQNLFLDPADRVNVDLSEYKDAFLDEGQLDSLVDNCGTYLKTRRYIRDPATAYETSFPIAFSLVVHEDPALVERLLRAIYRPQNYYCIHIDAKSSASFYKTLTKLASCFPNVFVSKERAEVFWGYIGVLEAELICMRELLQKKDWKYFVNLSENEFPLKTNLELVDILRVYNGSNEISNLPANVWSVRWKYVHTPTEYRTNQTKAPPPHNITIHKGDVHVVLSREFVTFAINDYRAQDLAKWLEDAFCPEELFFSSLQFNRQLEAPGAYKGDIGGRYTGTAISRHKIWQYEEKPCMGLWLRNICVYGVDALPSLIKDDHAFFINKLIKDYQPLTYDCLEELYFNRTYEDYNGGRSHNLSFYADQYFVNNHF